MKMTWQVATLATALTACAGPAASGQPSPASDPSLERLHAYEVPSEGYTQMPQQSEPGWIQVGGTGSVQVAPDRASVAFAMETRAATADGAAGANADAMDAVLRAIRGSSFPGLVLETFGYSLRPEYSQNNNNQRTREIVAYTVLNNVRATIEDVDAVGRVIDAAIGAGANRVAGINFFASDTEAARTEALAEAVRSARAEATVIAESLGYRLGAPLEINGGAARPTPRPYEMASLSARAADTPIEAGDQTVTASVSIRFALGPELAG